MKTGNTLFAIFLFYMAYKLPAEIFQRITDKTVALQIIAGVDAALIVAGIAFLWTSRRATYLPPNHHIEFKRDVPPKVTTSTIEKRVDEKTMHSELDKLFEDREKTTETTVQQHL